MRVEFHISDSEQKKFQRACEAAITNVGTGSQSAVMEASQEIMMEAMNQVPRDTGTLAKSAFIGVSRRSDLKNYRYGAILGFGQYAGIGSSAGLDSIDWIWPPNNGVNPKSGLRASVYATRVHEDASMPHKYGGKAKFLEDPVREWAAGKFARTAARYWKTAIEQVDAFVLSSSSNKELYKQIKRGDLKKPDVEAARAALDRARRDPTMNTYNARINLAKTEAAKHTYMSVIKNPSSTKQYGMYNSYGRKINRHTRLVQIQTKQYHRDAVRKETITKSNSRGK